MPTKQNTNEKASTKNKSKAIKNVQSTRADKLHIQNIFFFSLVFFLVALGIYLFSL